MLTILIKAYYVDVVLDIKPIYLNRRYLFKNKFYYLDKIYFYYSLLYATQRKNAACGIY